MLGAFALQLEDGKVAALADRLRRHGGNAQARPQCRGGAHRPALERGDARGRRSPALAQGLHADQRLARERRLPRQGRGQSAATALHRDHRRARPRPVWSAIGASPMPEPMIAERIAGGVHQPRRHDSAWRTSPARRPTSTTCRRRRACCTSISASAPRRTRGSRGIDLEAVRAAPGVVLVLTAADVPGVNDVSPTHRHDEPLFATAVVEYAGQPLFAVAAATRDQARRAARLAVVEYEDLPAVLDVAAALPTGNFVTEPLTLQRGDAAAAIAAAPHRLEGPDRDRRPGPLLPRGPDRPGDPGRGRRGHGPLLDPAPERDPAHGGDRAGRAQQRRHRRVPAHGRRLRRQGDPGQPVRLRRRARSPRRPGARPRSAPTATTTW